MVRFQALHLVCSTVEAANWNISSFLTSYNKTDVSFFSFTNLNEIKVFNFQYHKGIIKLELKFMVMILLSSFFTLLKVLLLWMNAKMLHGDVLRDNLAHFTYHFNPRLLWLKPRFYDLMLAEESRSTAYQIVNKLLINFEFNGCKYHVWYHTNRT